MVAEPFAELALTTPYEQCLPHWVRQRSNLSQLDFSNDPLRYPLAQPSPVQPYADRSAFVKRLQREAAWPEPAWPDGLGGSSEVSGGGARRAVAAEVVPMDAPPAVWDAVDAAPAADREGFSALRSSGSSDEDAASLAAE